MNFTGTSTEYMMRNNRAGSEVQDKGKKALSPDHPCYGCSYVKDTGCIGYCIKKLMQKGSGK